MLESPNRDWYGTFKQIEQSTPVRTRAAVPANLPRTIGPLIPLGPSDNADESLANGSLASDTSLSFTSSPSRLFDLSSFTAENPDVSGSSDTSASTAGNTSLSDQWRDMRKQQAIDALTRRKDNTISHVPHVLGQVETSPRYMNNSADHTAGDIPREAIEAARDALTTREYARHEYDRFSTARQHRYEFEKSIASPGTLTIMTVAVDPTEVVPNTPTRHEWTGSNGFDFGSQRSAEPSATTDAASHDVAEPSAGAADQPTTQASQPADTTPTEPTPSTPTTGFDFTRSHVRVPEPAAQAPVATAATPAPTTPDGPPRPGWASFYFAMNRPDESTQLVAGFSESTVGSQAAPPSPEPAMTAIPGPAAAVDPSTPPPPLRPVSPTPSRAEALNLDAAQHSTSPTPPFSGEDDLGSGSAPESTTPSSPVPAAPARTALPAAAGDETAERIKLEEELMAQLMVASPPPFGDTTEERIWLESEPTTLGDSPPVPTAVPPVHESEQPQPASQPDEASTLASSSEGGRASSLALPDRLRSSSPLPQTPSASRTRSSSFTGPAFETPRKPSSPLGGPSRRASPLAPSRRPSPGPSPLRHSLFVGDSDVEESFDSLFDEREDKGPEGGGGHGASGPVLAGVDAGVGGLLGTFDALSVAAQPADVVHADTSISHLREWENVLPDESASANADANIGMAQTQATDHARDASYSQLREFENVLPDESYGFGQHAEGAYVDGGVQPSNETAAAMLMSALHGHEAAFDAAYAEQLAQPTAPAGDHDVSGSSVWSEPVQ